ncbi:hypothetical protein RHMOL_Rhmol03G0166700 [Rhododendron molle]|uniref:Uncharacterized protein n=1 Tax=Rhododendron molle TaxID=49168 RepID=A0ACC0PFM7_RHOML|nr:hypothetical protein RHMOL_Rhmol03G0166700 [Rhododendron molle]
MYAESSFSPEGSCENPSMISSQDPEAKSERAQTNAHHQRDSVETESDAFTQATYFGQDFVDSIVLICCEDALHLYSLKSLIKGESESIRKVKLEKPCCWTTIFKKDGKACGLILVYQTGLIEIRSLPDLELVGESSLMSILRWNFKTSMTKTISSSDTGHIVLTNLDGAICSMNMKTNPNVESMVGTDGDPANKATLFRNYAGEKWIMSYLVPNGRIGNKGVVNGNEVAFISLFAFENDFRIPEALPCLHDKVLEAATDATFMFSQSQKKQGTPPGIIGGIIKSFKGGTAENHGDGENIVAHLERIFSRFPFSDPFTGIADDQEVIVLGIDDIDLDEPAPVTPSSHKRESKGKDIADKETERGKLFEGGSTGIEPRMRTAEEIRAKYRKDGDASSAAAHARDKLVERQEKLEKLSRRTAELQSGAENFADLASELAKTMEKRKWWHI